MYSKKQQTRRKKKRQRVLTFKGERVPAHIAVYCSYFDVNPSGRFVMPCEMGCGRRLQDIHHISARGMGGDPQGKKDTIENLMGLCRECHRECEAEKVTKEAQIYFHNKALGKKYPPDFQ